MAFLVFEGIDGAGKTSLISQLSSHLESAQIQHLVTREPGGTDLGDEIREILIRTKGEAPLPRAELLLYEAIRAQHVDAKIKPAIDRSIWVLCDRFTASSVAFQKGGRDLNTEDVVWLNNFATAGTNPDYFVLLDLPVEESQKRRHKRESETKVNADRFEQEKVDFHQRVRDSYLQQAKDDPSHWIVLNATKKPEEIFEDLLAVLKENKCLES